MLDCFSRRSASTCLNLNNVTLVVPTQEELNYQVFMYTMFNSPAPALRELTSFYRADLNTTVIQVTTSGTVFAGARHAVRTARCLHASSVQDSKARRMCMC